MRNITISLEEDLAKWVRVWAAEHDTSVSALLAKVLREKKEAESTYSHAYHSFLDSQPQKISHGRGYPTRDQLYGR